MQPSSKPSHTSEMGAREMAKPFLKWAGGKTALLSNLLQAAPNEINTYYEPFLGGGALFFALQAAGRFRHAVLSDSNLQLINAYTQVRDNVDALIRGLSIQERKYLNATDRAEYYYKIRAKQIACDLGGAVNLIFLNKTCYNGLYRVNSNGHFNVPHGRYKNPTICAESNLRAVSAALQGVELQVADFAAAPATATDGDFVYFDPPYVPLSETASFTSYTAQDFGMAEQERLARTARQLACQGATVILSNSGHPDVAEMYASQEFQLNEVQVRRAINSNAAQRGPVREYLIQST